MVAKKVNHKMVFDVADKLSEQGITLGGGYASKDN